MARKAVTTRRVPGPVDQSRGTGPRVPDSAASHSPAPFYDADDEEPSALDLDAVRARAVGVEDDISADQSVGASVLASLREPGAAASVSTYEDDLARVAELRSGRRVLGSYSQKLALDARRGYHRHWFNDTAGRIDEAVAAGWAHVQGRDGAPIKRCVGTGRDRGALFAYAMEIPLVFWQEDQDAKHEAAANVMDNLKRSPFRADKGTMRPEDKGTFYDPTESGSPISIAKR